MEDEKKADKLELIATRDFVYYEDMYKVVDFLNKNLKDKKVMLGLTQAKETQRLQINVYEF